jgi:hypothetical protein
MKTPSAILLAVFALLIAVGASAQTQTGTIVGRIADEQGGVLPGVTVTLTGGQGSVTQVTDAKGEYRFQGLTPGVYQVNAQLQGFAPRTERSLEVGLAKTLTVNLALKIGGLSETVEVVTNASTIDLTSPATETTISKDLLSSMPLNIGTFNTATALLNFSPGINGQSAFGGDASYGNALLIDGVDTRDPEAGSAWVFYNYNIVDEVQVSGLGAAAEYGGFSGAVVNTITKSGTNVYKGLFETRYTNGSMATNNITSDQLKLNPALGQANKIQRLTDYTVQLGGPIKKDRAFWWASIQRYSFVQDPVGPRTKSTEVSPRYNGKVTLNLSSNDTFLASVQNDTYNVTGRTAYAGNFSTDNQTVTEDSPETVWNAQYRRVFNSSTFLEAKVNGYGAFYNLDPVDSSPIHTDQDTGEYRGGGGYYYYAGRSRYQGNVTLSKFAEAFGSHNFKFGFEIERSGVHTQSEYSGCGSIGPCYFIDYSGVPTYAYSGLNYNVRSKNKRESVFAQDAWKKGRLTLNLGVRLDHIRGYSQSLDKTVYSPKLAVGPRLGGVFDLTGTGRSVVRAFWGRYYEGASQSAFASAVGGFEDYKYYDVLPGGKFSQYDETTSLIYRMQDSPKHFGLDETNLGFEQQIRRDMRLTVTGIWRNYMNFIGSTLPAARWSAFSYASPMPPNQNITLYKWANKPASTAGSDYLIQNLDNFQFLDASGNPIAAPAPYRNYKGVMFVLTKTMSHNWQGQVSYVYSQTKGNINNAGRSGFGGSGYENPVNSIVNTDGYLANDRPHEFKAMLGYSVPKIDLSFDTYFSAISGSTYTAVPSSTVSSRTLNWFSSLRPYLQPLGSSRLPTLATMNLRIEKGFRFGPSRISAWIDFGNLLNASTVTGVQTRYPNRSIPVVNSDGSTTSAVVLYDSPTSVTTPRQVMIGARWKF